MHFLGLEMARAEKCTKSCMFNQMLVRDWDAHNVANVAKEEKNWLKRGSTGFIQSLFGPVSILFWVKGHFFTIGRNQFHTQNFSG